MLTEKGLLWQQKCVVLSCAILRKRLKKEESENENGSFLVFGAFTRIPFQLLSRLLPKKKPKEEKASTSKSGNKRKIPELNEYLANRDYAGAISILSVMLNVVSEEPIFHS